MSPDVLGFAIASVIGLYAGIQLEKAFARDRRAKWRRKSDKAGLLRSHPEAAPKVPDAADQLRTVMKANFKPQPLLNKSEARLFKAMDKIVLELRPDWQVMAQVSLGEILSTADKSAYACVNSKRVDLLIVDGDCKPFHAFEYQGGGHFKGAHATAARDAVKKEALRRAGIGYIEVLPGDTPAELRGLIEKLLQQPAVTR